MEWDVSGMISELKGGYGIGYYPKGYTPLCEGEGGESSASDLTYSTPRVSGGRSVDRSEGSRKGGHGAIPFLFFHHVPIGVSSPTHFDLSFYPLPLLRDQLIETDHVFTDKR